MGTRQSAHEIKTQNTKRRTKEKERRMTRHKQRECAQEREGERV